MASRTYAFFGVGMAAVVGVLTSYVTFQPELQKQQLERQGVFQDQHVQQQQPNEHVISDAILSDLREAEQQVTGTDKKGALWGLRETIWGKKQPQTSTPAPTGSPAASVTKQAASGEQLPGVATQQPSKESGSNG